ncbi:FG-GAP-like repeat-containing protein [Neorhodopirellula pilleata]|uniref:Tetratricopeptide repeat protein n=1 Tax=Neorhodopirellula pilleata TaxID=2714738 RepID=A0A5C6A2D3_9BACT|nr:FG-GAP-like repeat-containing protein [Neorhodopirellula pilleata]TWT93719.1 tetratricopeptide repeat protein [Neorhodopirellula pilleata]
MRTASSRFVLSVILPAVCSSLALAIILTSTGCRPSSTPQTPAKETSRTNHWNLAERAIRMGDWATAESRLREVVIEDPQNYDALERLGDLASRRGRCEDAIGFYREIVDQGDHFRPELIDKLCRHLMIAGKPFEVVDLQQECLIRHPQLVQQRSSLAGLASMLGLERVAVEHLKWLVMHQQGHPEGLTVLSHPEFVQPDQELCEEVLRRCPEDQRAQYGLAKLDAMKWNWRQVASRLETVVEQHDQFVPAYCLYGRALLELNDIEAFERWQKRPPAGADTSPDFWMIAGMWADRGDDSLLAARAFLKSIRLGNESHSDTLRQLAHSLSKLQRDAEAKLVYQRIGKLTQLHDATKTLFERSGQSQSAATEVAKVMHDLGRIWEAEAWARLALTLPQDRSLELQKQYLAIRSKIRTDTPWRLPGSSVGDFVRLADIAGITWESTKHEVSQSVEQDEIACYVLEDHASRLGLHHSTAPSLSDRDMHWVYRSLGGGAATIDFDLDGWPDLALAVQTGHPFQEDSNSDQIYRNQDGYFDEVASMAGFDCQHFSHGMTTGDYNSDGFPDLFVSTIGVNQLFRNNGDGTFTNVTDQVGLSGQFWTCSSAIADINGDSIADLFEVNYCGGSQFHMHPCRDRTTGDVSHCTPLDFPSQTDRVWVGRGDGSFMDATDDWMKSDQPGRGLGLVVGQLDNRPGIDVYVANDMTANHLWSSDHSGSVFELDEVGTLCGVAVSGQSLSQASMGIAAADADDDGDLDLFVTHFSDEHNTFYERSPNGYWSDRSHRVGLAAPSMKWLGFGTQFVDLDNDGSHELIVANGHISDLGRDDVPYRMPAQLFYRGGDHQWREMSRDMLGDYFRQGHLGRSLITLDANRDGLIDVLVTQLSEETALLINQTGRPVDKPSATINLMLQGTGSHRDAVGAEIMTTVDGKNVYRQLTAGDGYMGTNQKRISIGGFSVGSTAHDVTIRWPSGQVNRYHGLDPGKDYLVVEGTPQPYPYSTPSTSLR